MLSFLTALGWRAFVADFPVNVVKTPEDPDTNNLTTIYKVIDYYTKNMSQEVRVIELPKLRENGLKDLMEKVPSGHKDSMYVLPAVDIVKEKFQRSDLINVTKVDSMDNIKTVLGSYDGVYVIGQSDLVDIHTDFTNYWVPAVWDSFIVIVIFIALTSCSITYFSKISVQTKFTKRD